MFIWLLFKLLTTYCYNMFCSVYKAPWVILWFVKYIHLTVSVYCFTGSLYKPCFKTEPYQRLQHRFKFITSAKCYVICACRTYFDVFPLYVRFKSYIARRKNFSSCCRILRFDRAFWRNKRLNHFYRFNIVYYLCTYSEQVTHCTLRYSCHKSCRSFISILVINILLY